jgi:hypothetical protein
MTKAVLSVSVAPFVTASIGLFGILTGASAQTDRGPRSQPDTEMGLYAPSQHQLYDGHFIIRGARIYQVGILNDESPWDHMGDDASNLRPVGGSVSFDVNEIENTGTFRAELDLLEGRYVVELDRFHEFSSCQDGGIAAYLFEHGNSGCGDSNWPKSLLYVAGWGYGHATLNGNPLYQDYEIHFMVTQGMRDRETLEVMLEPSSGEAGAVNPAAQQLDFYIRSPERNDANHPNREVFDHFFAMEVTWQ